MSSTTILGERRLCTVSIHWPGRSARAARFSGRVSHSVSKRPIWLAEGYAGQDRPQRRARHCAADAARLVFRPVHCKSLPAQEVRALLTARKLLQTKNHAVEMSLRGVLRGFGLSQWLYAGMRDAGFTVELLETRHVHSGPASKPIRVTTS